MKITGRKEEKGLIYLTLFRGILLKNASNYSEQPEALAAEGV